MDIVRHHVRFAIRNLCSSPGFTATAVIVLALGIGATTAIFTLIDAVVLHSLPVSDPARLYRIGDGDDSNAAGRHARWGLFSFPLYERLRAAAPEFEEVTAFDWGGSLFSVRRQGVDDAARPLRAEYVTGTYFATLGVRPFIGRVLTSDDDRPSAPPVVVLTHQAWQSGYGADPSVVGSTFVVEGHPFTVIGVAARGFFGETVRADPPEMWIPLQQEPTIGARGSLLRQSVSPWLFIIGRLRRDASTDGTSSRLTQVLRHWIRYEADYPGNWMPDIVRDLPMQTVAVVPAGAGIGLAGLSAKEQYGRILQILLTICALVLVMACANVANLLLARAAARRAHTAVRVAIGATRPQIVADALAESVVLAMAGGLAAVPVAAGTARLLIALAFRNAHVVPITATPSLAVLAFAFGLAVVTGVVFGVAPAWVATRTDPIDALRAAGRGSDRSSRARSALLLVQATLSVVLVACATMLARSLANLEHQDLGYGVAGRVLIGVNRLPSTYSPQQLATLYRDVEQRLADLPGVTGSGLALYNPLGASNWSDTILVAGHRPGASTMSAASWNRVSSEYLQNLGVTVLRGRMFTGADNETAEAVAVVNEAFVKRFFTDREDPLDQRFGVERPEYAATFRIVGIVRDAKFASSRLNQPARPMFFVPLAQRVDYQTDYRKMIEALSHFIRGIMLVTDVPPGELEPRLRKTLSEADPNLAVINVRTLRQQLDFSLDRERAVARLAELFGIVALVLASVGVYAVTACIVAQRRNEIGIRMALGADRAGVIGLVLRRALRHVVAGLVVSLPLAVGAARAMATQLYGVTVWDPVALSVAAGSLAACAFVAAVIPAGRAAAISPMSALRRE
jgi:predicted permease